MRVLVLTQVIDERDDVLGFFHGWVAELAKQVEHVHVVALRVGTHHLPANVEVTSLGKEHGSSSWFKARTLATAIIGGSKSYDRVIVHMNPEYLVIFGWFWRLTGKRSLLWYMHKHVDWKLRIATLFVDTVATGSSESFRIDTPKKHVLGHGIDTEHIVPPAKKDDDVFRVVTVGRISRVKGYATLVDAFTKIGATLPHTELLLVGGPVTKDDELYLDELRALVAKSQTAGRIHFVGSVAHPDILPYLQRSSVFVNCSATGSLDKAVLEAMAAGLPVLTSNDGLQSALGEHARALMFKNGDAAVLAEKLLWVATMPDVDRVKLTVSLREIVETRHSVSHLMPQIVGLLQ